MAKENRQPSFILYDLYLGPSSPTPSRWENYRAKLTARRANLSALNPGAPIPVLHLAQLHSSNAFQHGLGFTPSRKELDDIVALDGELGFKGIGYYTKNAVKTDAAASPEAYDPNVRGGTTSAESSTDRWDYGLTQLFEKTSASYRDWFDLVLYGRFTANGYQVFAQRTNSDQWDLIGYADRTIRDDDSEPHAVVLRFINAQNYLGENRTELKLKLVAAPGSPDGTITKGYIVPSRTAAGFRSARSIESDILSGGIDGYAKAIYHDAVRLGVGTTEFKLTTDTPAP